MGVPVASEDAGLRLAHESPEQATVRRAVAGGATEVDSLTNLVFLARHPERGERGLSPAEPGFAALRAEWTTIRDTVVRPLLGESPSTPSTGGDLWVAGAERVANAKAAGGSYVDGPWRFVFHTIEGEPSAAGFRMLAAGHGNPPHLWAMPSTDLLLQTIPLNRSAYALSRPGSLETNRLRAIQVECWGFAAKMDKATPETLNWLADRVLAPVARLVPINLDRVRPTGGERCYGKTSACRMTPEEWRTFDGVCGHQHVGDNDHWDPGDLKLSAIAARAKVTLSAGSVRREAPLSDVPGLSDHDGPNFAAERDDAEAPWALAEHNGHEAPQTRGGFDQLTPPPAAPQPPLPPRPPLKRPVWTDRPCCLLLSKSLTGVNKLDGNYEKSQPGILYTGKAGFVDLGHLWSTVDVTGYAYQQIHAAGGKAGTKVLAMDGDATLTGAAPPTEWLELARSIAYDDAMAHEIAFYWDWRPGAHNSAFSPEDLCSNYLGTVVAAQALLAATHTPRTSFVAEAYRSLRLLLTALDAQSDTETKKAFDLISNRWVDMTQWLDLKPGQKYLRRRNFTPVPWPAGHPSDRPTPAWAIGASFKLTTKYDYRHVNGFGLGDFTPLIAKIRADAMLPSNYGPNYDKP
jgi:hypothetical protein